MRMFLRCKLDVLMLSDPRMKDKGERAFGPVLGKVSGVDVGRGRKEVGLL